MRPRDILIATHGHCFDGMASAALYTALRQGREPGAALSFRYKSCGYGPAMAQIPEAWLDGDENVILDFRYTESQRLTEYFDHHVTGFGSPEERDRALAAAGARGTPRIRYDAARGSCASIVAEAMGDEGIALGALGELIGWADVIDAARFPSAEAAIDTSAPVIQLAGVVEHHGDALFLQTIVPELIGKPVSEVAASETIRALWQPIAASREAFTKSVREHARVMGPVVMVDLAEVASDLSAKFTTYALFPECAYSVTLSRMRQHYKVSVGYNPWSPITRKHDIASICKRFDGGGHPVVGACSFPLSALDRARAAVKVIVAELGGEGGQA